MPFLYKNILFFIYFIKISNLFKANLIESTNNMNFSNIAKVNSSKQSDDNFVDICPGVTKTIDCSATENFIYLKDAFYGVSSDTPAVCEYK